MRPPPPPHHQQQKQYYYLYGSVDEGEEEEDRAAAAAAGDANSSANTSVSSTSAAGGGGGGGGTTTDGDSLVGEGLILTDNDDDDDNADMLLLEDDDNAVVGGAGRGEMQQLLMTGTGGSNGSSSKTRGNGFVTGTFLRKTLGGPNGTSRRRNDDDDNDGIWGPYCCRGCGTWRLGGGECCGLAFSSSSSSSRSSFRRRYPLAYSAAWTAAMGTIGVVLFAAFFPNSRIGQRLAWSSPGSGGQARQFVMPFPVVHRDDGGPHGYNDPVSNMIDVDLFHPTFLDNAGIGGSSKRHTFVFPFPTGAFWTNLVLPPTADRGFSYPVVVYPYAYKWSDSFLQVSYPEAHRKEEPKAIHDYFFPDLTFGTVESVWQRHITAFDALSVSLKFYLDERGGGSCDAHLVQGSPYITLVYKNASPTIRALSLFDTVVCPREDEEFSQLIINDSNAEDSGSDNEGDGAYDHDDDKRHRRLEFGICSSARGGEDSNDSNKLYLRGVQFIMRSMEGLNYMVFSSEPIEFMYDIRSRTTVVAQNRFTGVLRIALIPTSSDGIPAKTPSVGTAGRASLLNLKQNQTSSSQVDGSIGLQRLIYHAGVYPVSGSVSWSFRSSDGASTGLKEAAEKTIAGAMGMTKVASISSSSSSKSSTPMSSGRSSRIGTVNFQFSTETFSPPSSTTKPIPLLMLALPHHAKSLSPHVQLGNDQFELVYRCIKGPLRPVLGASWNYDEPLPMVGFEKYEYSSEDNSRSSAPRREYMNPAVRKEIVKSLDEDIKLALPTLDENVYGFGKQTARLAQLAHIAHQLHMGTNTTAEKKDLDKSSSSEEDEDDVAAVHDRAVKFLRNALEHFLSSSVSDFLVYDTNLGGIVTNDGLLSSGSDFGNGRYNDHHFHYGYLLYACAIMGKIDPTFVTKYGSHVDAVYYDVAHDANFASSRARGIFFPGARHKVWFDGHSFASGLFPFGNGKSQESSSEAVNCYYGAYLWSVVRHGAALDPESDSSPQTDFARLLLAMEIRGAQMYWHMTPPSTVSGSSSSGTNHTMSDSTASVYNPVFSSNYMVGNVGMLDVVASTWFGTENLYVHLINEIPVTAVTEELFDRAYVKKEYYQVLAPLGEVEMAWRGYLVCNHAIVDPMSAWTEALKLFSPELDSAVSKSQVLYWVATRPEFNASLVTSSSSPASSPSAPALPPRGNASGSQDASCTVHPACVHLGLIGDCCPTTEGGNLDCCNNR